MLTVKTAGDSERDEALRLLYSRLPPPEQKLQIAALLSSWRRGELTLDDLLVARDGDRAVGALLMVRRPGRTAFLWPPVCANAERSHAGPIAARLLQSAAQRLDEQGVQFTQALLDLPDHESRQLLERHGFPERARLTIWERATDAPTTKVEDPLRSIGYAPEHHERFARTLERTLEGTLDCPIVSRLRTGDEALAAHRATGQFRPAGWRLYQERQTDVAILLVADFPDSCGCELAYLGVVPEARGRGWGTILVRDAVGIGRELGRKHIEVAVDLANSPALAIYQHMGFQRVRELAVHLRLRTDGPRAD